MKKAKRVYSESFKEKAVSLSYQRENIKELADELGVQVQRIYKWRASGRKQVNLKTITNSKLQEELPEVKRLKKELKETQLELEILKKAVHIFSKSDGKPINL
jgi:transposase